MKIITLLSSNRDPMYSSVEAVFLLDQELHEYLVDILEAEYGTVDSANIEAALEVEELKTQSSSAILEWLNDKPRDSVYIVEEFTVNEPT